MNYEDKLNAALDNFEKVASGTDLVKYRDIMAIHANEMEKAAANCQFDHIAQHMRELGDESKGLDGVIDSMVKTKTLERGKSEKISGAISEVWTMLDDFIANELVENCSCKMRGINY